MAIAVRASGTATADVLAGSASPVSTSISRPAGVQSGDLMIASVSSYCYIPGGPISIATPSGWTLIGAVNASNGNAGAAFYRVSTGSDGPWTFAASVTGPGDFAIGIQIQTFSGTNASQPDATGTTSSTVGASSLTANAVTVVTSGSWEIICGTCGNGSMSATGFTALEAAGTYSNFADLLYNTTPKSSGSTGTVTVSQASSGDMTLIPFSVAPAAGGSVSVSVSAVFATGYAGGDSVALAMSTAAVVATGHTGVTTEALAANAPAVLATAYAGVAGTTVAIAAPAVLATAYAGVAGTTVAIAAPAVLATAYVPTAGVSIIIAAPAVAATGYVGSVSVVTGGIVAVNVSAVSATGYAGSTSETIAASVLAVLASGYVASITAGPSPGVSAVAATAYAGGTHETVIITASAVSAAAYVGYAAPPAVTPAIYPDPFSAVAVVGSGDAFSAIATIKSSDPYAATAVIGTADPFGATAKYKGN